MTLRTLFTIFLKILGLLFITDILAAVPQLFSVVLYLTDGSTIDDAVWTFISTSLILSVYIFVAYYLIFKTEGIINKLKLDKGFDEEAIALNMHRSTILSIAVIFIGGWMVADEIPNFCRQLFDYFQEKRMTYGQTEPRLIYAVLSAIQIIIGLLLIGNQRQIVNFIEYKRKQ